jgi:hypothetical protein
VNAKKAHALSSNQSSVWGSHDPLARWTFSRTVEPEFVFTQTGSPFMDLSIIDIAYPVKFLFDIPKTSTRKPAGW